METPPADLPIEEYRHQIESSIKKNPVTIITAETGAGKSTRIPYWMFQRGKKVHVTQPRRIAARSLSHYLSRIHGTGWGTEVGYQTGFDRKFSRNTRLLYLTDGVQMVQEIKQQQNYDVLIVDEVHEWNLNQEILIGLIKEKLRKKNSQKNQQHYVVMSATLEADLLSKFLHDAPIISVKGRGFPVSMHQNSPHFLLSDTIQMVEMEKNVLVFQPGKKEIQEFITLVDDTLHKDKLKAKILPLHSELSINEQSKVFGHYSIPKVVVSTDIAQTSLTIDDIDGVIDTGIKKEIQNIKGIEGLYPVDISQSECLQRAGRAGRVKTGHYILSSEFPMADRPPFPEPEIRRLNLESVILRFIKWGIHPLRFPYFHPPKRNLITKAIGNLKIFGAISEDDTITRDGSQMAELPVSIRSSRMLLEARKGSDNVLDQALKIIAIMEMKGISNKDFKGEKFYSGPYRSDLLNQLVLWNTQKSNRRWIGQKKLAMAKEIYRELKNRIHFNAKKTPPDTQESFFLFRALLSSFVDHIFEKTGSIYTQNGSERQLDRNSILSENKPEMIVGIPFDLIIQGENPQTGDVEKVLLPLVTFASEISYPLLEQLKPFSYQKEKEVLVKNSQILVRHVIYFGHKLLAKIESPPDFKNQSEKTPVIKTAKNWIHEHLKNYPLYLQWEKTKRDFEEISKIIGKHNHPFSHYWEAFLERELAEYLKQPDLDYFLKCHRGFVAVTLKNLLPKESIKKLKSRKWPKYIHDGETSIPVIYIRHKPFLKLKFPQFEKMSKLDLRLPTGEPAGIFLGKKMVRNWEQGVQIFNQWKRENIFNKKWKNLEKSITLESTKGLSFPISFEAGTGKENTRFYFYGVPKLKNNQIFLIHFMEEEEAKSYFHSISDQWEACLKSHQKEKMETIFKNKGWKVKS